MASLNKVILICNVGVDPEIRSANGAKVASFRVATTEKYKDRNGEVRENTEWHNVSAWRNVADIVEKFVHKGSQLYIEGKLHTREWTDNQGGKRFTTEVVADKIQLLGPKPRQESSPGSGYSGGNPNDMGF